MFTLKRFVLALMLVITATITVWGEMADDIRQHPSCRLCGMDRQKFAQSRTVIEFEDGTTLESCSIHCAAAELAVQLDKTPLKIMVGDFTTSRLIDAEKAIWVIVKGKPGVMTKQAKWSFAERPDAEAFIKANGGTLATFDDAIKATYQEMYEDTKMIRERRKMKRMKAM